MQPSSRPDVVIVGAGIAGLTTAIALDRVGIAVTVVERASALTEAGTALSLWPNALAALDRIGLADAVVDIGIPEPSGTVRKPSGRLIMRLDQGRLHRHLESPTVLVHRGELQQVLLEAASHLTLRLATVATRVATVDGRGVVELADGELLQASAVLACDGIRSVARTAVANPDPVYRGRTSWRAVLDDVADLVPDACLTVGTGLQFIASPLRGGRTYWAADVGLPEGANQRLTDRRGFLLGVFAGWHDPIAELIGRTREDQLVIADLADSIPERMASGRVALLGDAAHPMTPDLGQGACQGIEDAVVLAACLAGADDAVGALLRYQSARLPRVQMIVRESRRIGALATARSPWGAALRDHAVSLMPDWLNSRLVARYASEASFTRTLPTHGSG